MQLVYVYGPPGVGKFTVAKELVALTGFKLFHNHLVVKLAASIFSHQSEPYFRLIRQIWRDTFTEAVHQDVDFWLCELSSKARPSAGSPTAAALDHCGPTTPTLVHPRLPRGGP